MSIEVAGSWGVGRVYIRVGDVVVNTVQISEVAFGHLKNYLSAGHHTGTAKFLAVCETDPEDYIEVVYVAALHVHVFISEGVGENRITSMEIVTTEEFLELLEQV
jgi:hypothetical protein